jgi:uncharacterized heparinase superfamily protein
VTKSQEPFTNEKPQRYDVISASVRLRADALQEQHFLGAVYRLANRIKALMTNDTPITTSIPAQNANHVLTVVDWFRNVVAKKLAPDQKTKFPIVSAVLPIGDRHTSLSINSSICRMANPKQN